MSVDNFTLAQRVKEKYPEYADVDDQLLADAVIRKFPEYRSISPEQSATSNFERFAKSFAEGFIPFGFDADLDAPETTLARVSEVGGGILGTVAGFIPFALITGGASVPASSAKALLTAQKLFKVGKTAKAVTAISKIKELPKAAGLLGRIPGYMDTVVKVTAKSPLQGKMFDAGMRNLLTFGLHGQAHLPIDAAVSERVSELGRSGLEATLFTGAGALGELGKVGKNVGTPLALFGIGAGSDLGESDMSPEDRIISGLGLVAFHYAGLGLNKVAVKAKQRQALEALGMREEKAESLLDKTSSLIFDATQVKGVPRRKPGQKRRKFEGERMAIENEAQIKLEETAAKFPDQSIGWKSTDAMSLGITQAEITKAATNLGRGRLTAITTRAFQNLSESASEVHALTKGLQGKRLTDKDINKFYAILNKSVERDLGEVATLSSEIGRALQKHRTVTKPRRDALARLQEIPSGDKALARRAIDLFAKIDPENPREYTAFLKATETPTFIDYINEWFYNSILSGIPTHVVNSTSNTVWQAWQTPFRTLRALVDVPVAKLQGRQREFYLGEIAPMWVGFKRGFQEGVPKAFRVLKEGGLIDDPTKLSLELGGSLEAFARSPIAALRKIAPIVSAPSRLLRAEDIFARSIAHSGEINAGAYRIAAKEGLRGDALRSRMAELIISPTDELITSARKFADYSTFTDEMGKIAAGITRLRNDVPGGQFIVPFVRTISNLLKRGVELTPGIGLIGKGKLIGPNLSTTITNQALGTLITTYFATHYLDGNLTGAVPRKKAEREAFYRQGKLPWSIRIGDQWIQYRRIEPFNTALSAVAVAGDAWREKGKEPALELIGRMGLEMANNLVDSSYLSQLSDLMAAVNRGDNGFRAMSRFIQRFPTAFVPYSSFLRSISRATEAFGEEGAVLRNPDGTLQTIAAQTPGLTQSVTPRKDVWGRTILLEGGAFRQFLPYKAKKQTNEKLEIELERLGIYPGMPSKKIGDIELTKEEYDRYLTRSGEKIYKALTRIVNASGWDNLDDFLQERRIRRLIIRIREKERARLLRSKRKRGD